MGKNGGGQKSYYSVDQLRKKERKKELQKNKQQRVAQRIAIAKNQDHKEIFREIEGIDKILFDISQHPDANELVLNEKRNKLRAKFHNMLEVYKKEKDEEKVKELSKHEAEYLRNKAELMRFYEQIRKAQNVDINSISLPMELPSMPFSTSLPTSQPVRSAHQNPALANLNPPGPPPGPPPCLSDLLEDEDLEGLEAPKAEDKTDLVQNESIDSAVMPPPPMPPSMVNCLPPNPNPQFLGPPTGHPSIAPNSQFYGPRPPSGPIPSNIQRFMPPPGYPMMPTGGPPPNGWSSQFNGPQPPRPHVAQSSQKHLSQNSRPHQHDNSRETVQGAVVSAAPQRRNLIGEATAFMPTALLIKRGAKKPAPVPKTNPVELPKATNTADDAFNAFMKDINNLL